jgi:hypothetical protein
VEECEMNNMRMLPTHKLDLCISPFERWTKQMEERIDVNLPNFIPKETRRQGKQNGQNRKERAKRSRSCTLR